MSVPGSSIEGSRWFAPLDGVRALAATVVLASHVQATPVPTGTLAVWVFFGLSAFLLTGKFVSDSAAFSSAGLGRYVLRRAFRILPMYAVFVLVYGLILGDRHYIRDNLFHFHGNGHLWTINQELFFYAVLPVVSVAVLPLRRWPLVAAGSLVMASVWARGHLDANVVKVRAETGWTNVYFAPFLLGMAAAYVAPLARAHGHRVGPILAALVSAAFVGAFLYLGATMAPMTGPAADNTVEVGLLVAALLVWLVAAPANWLTHVLSNRVLRQVGLAGFSFYLWHWAVFTLRPAWVDEWGLFPLCWLATAAMAQATYYLVERPGIAVGERLTRSRPPCRFGQCERGFG